MILITKVTTDPHTQQETEQLETVAHTYADAVLAHAELDTHNPSRDTIRYEAYDTDGTTYNTNITTEQSGTLSITAIALDYI